MNLNAVQNLEMPTAPSKGSPEALRQAAVQFEAVLLMQLTSALNGTGEADEDALFGSDGGSDLAKKMFSEQMATTIANSGGIGLADSIMQQYGAKQSSPTIGANGSLTKVIAAVRDIKNNNAPVEIINKADVSRLTDKSVKNSVSGQLFKGDPNDAEVISTFADDIIKEDGADGLKPFMYNGQLINSTRPRIVPNAALTENKELLSVESNQPINSAVSTRQMPTVGRISSGFGMRFHPIDRRMKFHAGMDIAAPIGTPIKAAADGIVTFAGVKKGYGNVVIVTHDDGTETFYAHASRLFVEEGQTVKAGTTIAAVGSTGKSTGPHLHFEVRENGQPVDPSKFLSKVLPKFADK